MMDKMMESQGSIMTQLTRLLTEGKDKGKIPRVNVEEEGDDGPLYPPGFTPPHVQPQAEVYSRKSSVTIRPQQFQADASRSMNYQAGSGSSPETNPNPVVPDFDEAIEKKFKAMESTERYGRIDAKDLSLVPDLVLPYKFKMPEFE
ncbi:hypothetical protein Godav_005180, partial [Gossypium davidsonii]|nr:hypothetical protein [Gossypium davidsonii]